MNITVGHSLGGLLALVSGQTFPPPPPSESNLTVSVDNTGRIVADIDDQGNLTIAISNVSAPANYNGTYAADVDGLPLTPTALLEGPLCLAPPTLSGDDTPAYGETMAIIPGLWIYSADAPSISYSSTGAGEVSGLNYTVAEADANTQVTIIETAQSDLGERSAQSAPIFIDKLRVEDTFETYPVGAQLSKQVGWKSLLEQNGYVQIVAEAEGQSVVGTTANETLIVVRSETFAPAQFAEVTVRSTPSTFGISGPIVRAPSKFDYYQARFIPNAVRIERQGSYIGNVATPVSIGDVVRIEAEGDLIRLLVNGVLQDSVVDSNLPDGDIGIAMRQTQSDFNPIFGDFRGGNL